MADRPTQVPEWATGEGADIVEPPAEKKAQGWVQGEKPPAGYFNWFFSQLARWIAWFAQEIKERPDGGISVPGGIESDVVNANRVNAKHITTTGEGELPGLAASGGPNAPAMIGDALVGQTGGLFRGTFGVDAETYGHPSNPAWGAAVRAWVQDGADGIPLICQPSNKPQPLRGAINIEPSFEPSQPMSGEIYIDADSHRVRWYDGLAWVDIAIGSEESARHVVGDPGEPPLGSGYTVAPGGGLYMPSFYFDGRRVWLDGYVQHMANQPLDIFTLPVGFRPDHDVYFHGCVVGVPAAAVVVTTAGVVTVQQAFPEDIFNVSLAGLSFEVAP